MTCPRTAGKEKGNKTTTNKSGRTSTEEGGGEKNKINKKTQKKNTNIQNLHCGHKKMPRVYLYL